jgi:hypothetical protein
MKRTSPKRLQLNVETVRTLQQVQPLAEADLIRVVGGMKGHSGYYTCTVTPCG